MNSVCSAPMTDAARRDQGSSCAYQHAGCASLVVDDAHRARPGRGCDHISVPPPPARVAVASPKIATCP
eukprot:scaffold23702_cov105-Phaeocystis_antarctica.AAC.3